MSKDSQKTLKRANQPKVMTFVVVNLIIVGTALSGHEQVLSLIREGVKDDWALLIRILGLPALGTLAVGLLGWVVPRNWKEVLVFWRVGHRRLPSSEAFTRIAPGDLRIDMTQLSTRLGPLPTASAQQNTVWYSVYRKHCNEAPVNDANCAYLLYRDITAMMPLLLVTAVLLGVVLGASLARMAGVSALLCIEFLLFVAATRNAGIRLVANVLAIESSTAEQTGKKLIAL